MVAREAPDLILMDVMLPGLDGREVARAIRAAATGAAVPIVLMSAAIALPPLDADVRGFLPKLLDLNHLLGMVAQLLADA